MKLAGDLEREIYAAAYVLRLATLLDLGYPHAWRVEDQEKGTVPGERIAEWERWCADLAVECGLGAVASHRKALRRRGHGDGIPRGA